MVCQKCKKNEASIHIVKVQNGEKEEIWMCEICAKEISKVHIDLFSGNKIDKNFEKVIGDLFQVVDNNVGNKTEKKIDIICTNCGQTYSNFKNTGKLGCPKCYDNFRQALEPVIIKLQNGLEHIGKIPKMDEEEFVERKRIVKLKEQLQLCILSEEYERAAEIRDEIKTLETITKER